MHKIVLFILALALASCSPTSSVDRQLTAAESIMEAHPDSALRLLESIRKDDLRSDRQHALYGLLMTQALDKNYVDVTSDSLIQPAVDYYSDSSDKLRLMKSLYYLAGVEYYRKAYAESLIASFRAYDIACDLNDKFWVGMTARRISDIYEDNYCAKEQMEFARIALDNFRQTGRTPFIHYALYDLANAYHANEDYTTARQMSTELLDTAKIYGDDVLQRQVLEIIGLGYLALDSLTAAGNTFREILPLPTARVSDSAYYNGICLRMHRTDDLVGDVSKLVTSKELTADISHWLQCQWYMAHDSASQTINMMRVINKDTNRSLKESRHQNLAGSLTDYHRYKENIEKINLRNAHVLTFIICIIAVSIIGLLGIYARRRHLRQQMLIDEYLTMGNELRILLAETSSELDKALSQTEDISTTPEKERQLDQQHSLVLLEKYFSEFDILCRNFRREPTADVRKKISESVEALIDSFTCDEKMSELEEYANYRYGGIMTKLRHDFPRLKNIDYTIFLLSRLGFSIPTVALLLKKEDDRMFIYNHRKRLKEKFRNFMGANRALYIDVMP